jgi:DNA-binding transcriptional MerR regulator
MLKIRDFARLAEVLMTTLRYYDDIGLLKPIHIDPETGYRFYTMDQLPHLHRILALKELGLELTQIVEILDEGVSPEAFQGMLRFRCELPACPRMASTIHRGAPALVMPAYHSVGTWMENNAYTIVGQRRKICLRRGDTLDDFLTEIQFPVEKVV